MSPVDVSRVPLPVHPVVHPDVKLMANGAMTHQKGYPSPPPPPYAHMNYKAKDAHLQIHLAHQIFRLIPPSPFLNLFKTLDVYLAFFALL